MTLHLHAERARAVPSLGFLVSAIALQESLSLSLVLGTLLIGAGIQAVTNQPGSPVVES